MSSSSALGFLMLMTFPLLGGNDLLDLVSTEAYWKSRRVEVSVEAMLSELGAKDAPDISRLIEQLGADTYREREAAMKAIRAAGPQVIDQLHEAAADKNAEIAERAATLIEQLSGGLLTDAERRLMAIRTLGELKQREALPALEKLLKSREPFVAEYAQAAIASIEGKPYERRRPTQAERDEDLYLLPKECQFVLQAGADQRIKVSWEQTLRLVAQASDIPQPTETVKKYETAFRTLLERSGNVQVDLATVGVSGNLFSSGGLAVVVFRGRYRVAGFKDEAIKMGFGHAVVAGVDVVSDPRVGRMAIILASDERLVLVSGLSGSASIEEMVVAVKRGRGTLAENKKLLALVKTVDRTKPLWAATMPDEIYRGMLGIESLESMTLEVAQEKGGLAATCRVKATNFDAMQQKLDELMKFRQVAQASLGDHVSKNPHWKPAIELLNSLEVANDGKEFTITARVSDAGAFLMLPVVEGHRAVE
jgi:hypothetical protein